VDGSKIVKLNYYSTFTDVYHSQINLQWPQFDCGHFYGLIKSEEYSGSPFRNHLEQHGPFFELHLAQTIKPNQND